jgi:predicted metal-dependent hydrolase
MKSTGKVGTIQYILLTSRANRRITIRIGPDGVLTIRAPKRASRRTIEELITEHEEHLLSRIDEETRDAHTYEDGDRFPYAGAMISLQLRTGVTNRAHIEDGLLVVSSQNPLDKDRILLLIKALYRKEAEKRIKPLVEHWSRTLGVSTPRFTIRDSKKRWGSCSKAGRLNFSLRSQALGDEELSYLVLHEVAHLVHFNHSREFKLILQTHMNDYKTRQKRMFAMQRASQLIR